MTGSRIRRIFGWTGGSSSPRKHSSSGTVTPGARMSPADEKFLLSRNALAVSA